MRVPGIHVLNTQAAVIKLHEPDASLDQPARHQTLLAEQRRLRIVQTVELLHSGRFHAHVHRFRRAALHPVSEFVGRNTRRQFRVARILPRVHLIQLAQQPQARALLFGRDAVRRLQIDNRHAGGLEYRALVRGRHEAGTPVRGSAERPSVRIVNHHERGQILILRPEPVRHPRAHAGEAHPDHPRAQFVVRLHVIVRLPVHGSQQRQFIHLRGQPREDFRHIHPALPVLLERERRRHQRPRVPLPHDHIALAFERLPGVFRQRGLGIESVHVADPAAHEQGDHGLRAGLEVRLFRGQRALYGRVRGARAPRRRAQQTILIQQVSQAQAADTAAAFEQEIASRSKSFHALPHVQELVQIQHHVREIAQRVLAQEIGRQSLFFRLWRA